LGTPLITIIIVLMSSFYISSCINDTLVFRSNDKTPLFRADDATPAYVDALIHWNRADYVFELLENWIRRGESRLF
jgi:hypothetical protein